MTNVTNTLDNTVLVPRRFTIADAEFNPLAKLAAVAHGVTSCDAMITEKARELVEEARRYNREDSQRLSKPCHAKDVWQKVVREVSSPKVRPVNDELPRLVQGFFDISLRTGQSLPEIAALVNSDEAFMRDVASMSASVLHNAHKIRETGRVQREARKALKQVMPG